MLASGGGRPTGLALCVNFFLGGGGGGVLEGLLCLGWVLAFIRYPALN